MKGICAFRLGDAIQSIKNFNHGNRYKLEVELKKKEDIDKNKEVTGLELEYMYINLFIEETKHIFSDPEF